MKYFLEGLARYIFVVALALLVLRLWPLVMVVGVIYGIVCLYTLWK